MIAEGSRYEDAPLFAVETARHGEQIVIYAARYPAVRSTSTYTVRAGDRLDLLANRFYGDSRLWWYIIDANPEIFDPVVVQAGTLLRIPSR